ncbi:MAG: toll/interleukin-1 receptor domain-containing protein [Planctomycetes bacterium]|nr:toll/interleukin-1 receptor domain-containing protein [Planctomycetota bacterium]
MSENRPAAFISHSSPDDRYVQAFVQLLRALGFAEVFNDSDTIKPDEEFWPRIERGILDADVFVVVLSHASVKSNWVDREVQFSRANGKTVIPVRIDDCKLPPSLEGHNVIDLRQANARQMMADVQHLINRKIAPSRILRHSPAILFGREKWLDGLDAAWADQYLNLYTLVAWGGVGKTSLVAHWVAERLMKRGWPGVERYFDWSFYSQGTGESRQTSADLFINQALLFFGDPDPTLGSPWERGERLANLTRQHRTLLVLDGIEPLQYPPTDKAGMAGRLKDPALEALVQSLAADNPGLCIITTREHLKNVEALPTTAEKKLDQLLKEAAIALLRHLQITGTDEELEAAWRDAGGHALTLQLLGRFIADAYPDRDIRHYKQVHFVEAEEERSEGRSAFKVMIAYEKWFKSSGPEQQRELAILRLTGLFDRPISADCLEALRAEPAIPGLTDVLVKLKDTQWNIALTRLIDIDLLSRSGSGTDVAIDAHPLVCEYFAKQLQRESLESFRTAHSRLFDHLCRTPPYRPDGLVGLAPLYQAVAHGCLAGRQQEACNDVFFDRILRGTGNHGYYSSLNLGAIGADLGALAAFFEEPWSRLSPNPNASDQAWLLYQAGYRLIALGRLAEAVEPVQVSAKMAEDAQEWTEAAIRARNLSELEVTLGRLGDAAVDARRALKLGERAADFSQRVHCGVPLGYALHQAGRSLEAGTLFSEAERIQAHSSPEFSILYSLQGFQYIDLLLTPAERAAWQFVLRESAARLAVGRPQDPGQDALVTICSEAERRAIQTLSWVTARNWLLDIAFDHLILARAGLYRALLSEAPKSEIVELQSKIPIALAKLRQANHVFYLPMALLTTALYAGTLGEQPDEARRYLAEAQQIAERGPMPLYLADVHLHRARLFRDKAELAKARALIAKHGYWRRKEELEDAEAAAKGW